MTGSVDTLWSHSTVVLFSTGVPIGRVELDGGEPAAGYLVPSAQYENIAAPFRQAGDLLWRRRALSMRLGLPTRDDDPNAAPLTERTITVLRDAEIARQQLSIVTESGYSVETAWIDLTDAKAHNEPPFVLVYFWHAPSIVGAALRPAPRADANVVRLNPPLDWHVHNSRVSEEHHHEHRSIRSW
jgi:hypothetical protein